MKKTLKTIRTKILMFIFALVLPLSAAGTTLSLLDFSNAKADTNTATYNQADYKASKSITNGNFNSGSSNYSISTSITGWTGQVSDKKTTAGYINVGDTFQTYMSNTYYLSNNPGRDYSSSDSKILMINSKTKNSSDNTLAHQGYKSSSITLDENAFYSFQVAFKSDTNYNSYTDYIEKGTVAETGKTVSKANFTADGKSFNIDGTKVYVAFSYNDTNTTYYVEKNLTEDYTLSDDKDFSSTEFFYTDDNFYGFVDESSNPVYIQKSDLDENKVAAAGTKIYTSNLTYNSTNKNYTVAQNEKYYKSTTAYTSLNDYTYGSIYLSGLKDANGNPVKAEYVKISSKEWQTFYFFVATGSEKQTVTLDLWLGGEDRTSSGVVFFDNCQVYQYCENAFWETYKNYKDKKYTQEYTIAGNPDIQSVTTNCTSITNLSSDNTLPTSGLNFDFENGPYSGTSQPVSAWIKSGSGKAQVFSTSAPEYFKSTTGYNFVGSDLSCYVDTNGDVTVSKNKYVLALWANDQTVKLTSSDISIDSNKIYKIKANYKVSELSSGKAYMFVSENDNILAAYNITSDDYTVKTETSSSELSSNGSNEFVNNYNSVEFFVKGGSLYSSSVNISLGLGKDSETATGCVVFDNVTIEEATNKEYTDASDKIELGTSSKTPSIANGTFNSTDLSNGTNAPYAPADWTLTKEEGKVSYAGIINTAASEYAKYVSLYEENKANGVSDSKNPYYFAKVNNSPKNAFNSDTAINNVLMLSNVSSTWQKASISTISLAENSTNKIEFYYNSNKNINLTLTDSNGIKVFDTNKINSNGTWKLYSIYLKSSNAQTLTMTLGLGTETETTSGVAYFDNFTLSSVDASLFETKASTAKSNEDIFGAVDMTNMYQNLPTNNIGTDLNINNAPAYSGYISTGTAENNVGAIIKSEFFENGSTFHIDEDKNMFYLSNQGVGSYVIESKFPITLNGYYVLSFKVKTKFVEEKNNLDSEKTYNYGVSVGLTNFDLMKNIRCDEEYATYKVYFHTSENTDANLYISLVSDYAETCGTAVIYDLAIESVEEDVFNQAKSTTEKEDYSVNSDKVFVSKATDAEEEEEENNDNEESSNSSLSDLDWSLIISGSITALAIILAVVFSVLRKIKIRKIDIKRKEEYDRKSTLELAVIKKKAEKEQAAEIKEVQTNIDRFDAELKSMEKDHKERVVKLREQDQGKVSKQTDKEFKDYARKRAAVAEKLEVLEKQKQELQSPEHLLELERKIFAKEEYQKQSLEKASKAKNKADEKKSK